MRTSHEPLVSMHGCSKRYGTVTALDGLDFELGAGLTAVLGRNGAGKSTLVGLMLGLLRPDAGEIRAFGRAPHALEVRQQRGVMLQTAGLPRPLTVRELVQLFSGYYPAPRPLEETLQRAGIADVANRRCSDLSGGQKRRVQFALAICGGPRLLVLDEPTVALDLEARHEVWKTIRDLVAEGTTVLLTTHHMEEAEALADRIVVLDRGRIVADGTQEAIKARFATRTIRCRTQLTPVQLGALPGVRNVAQAGMHVVLQTDAVEQTMRALLDRDTTATDLSIVDTELEDAFLALTRSNQDLQEVA
ncbi:ABC transporter ATP-binding protein [Roseiterribacter gracilis]|uniref:Multidrug ABC transporter ATP-binding protein n=1 Tax=Roseiterribacter gracilis TaxID=2812848 RepID=A0A8S8XLU8_9PROT|nr:multidrug ABC transporter ATP-binding protein [Rhodospirillales bacterium TMPK1]